MNQNKCQHDYTYLYLKWRNFSRQVFSFFSLILSRGYFFSPFSLKPERFSFISNSRHLMATYEILFLWMFCPWTFLGLVLLYQCLFSFLLWHPYISEQLSPFHSSKFVLPLYTGKLFLLKISKWAAPKLPQRTVLKYLSIEDLYFLSNPLTKDPESFSLEDSWHTDRGGVCSLYVRLGCVQQGQNLHTIPCWLLSL